MTRTEEKKKEIERYKKSIISNRERSEKLLKTSQFNKEFIPRVDACLINEANFKKLEERVEALEKILGR